MSPKPLPLPLDAEDELAAGALEADDAGALDGAEPVIEVAKVVCAGAEDVAGAAELAAAELDVAAAAPVPEAAAPPVELPSSQVPNCDWQPVPQYESSVPQ